MQLKAQSVTQGNFFLKLAMQIWVKRILQQWRNLGRRYCGVWGVTPPKIDKNWENSGKIRQNSVTSGNICGC